MTPPRRFALHLAVTTALALPVGASVVTVLPFQVTGVQTSQEMHDSIQLAYGLWYVVDNMLSVHDEMTPLSATPETMQQFAANPSVLDHWLLTPTDYLPDDARAAVATQLAGFDPRFAITGVLNMKAAGMVFSLYDIATTPANRLASTTCEVDTPGLLGLRRGMIDLLRQANHVPVAEQATRMLWDEQIETRQLMRLGALQMLLDTNYWYGRAADPDEYDPQGKLQAAADEIDVARALSPKSYLVATMQACIHDIFDHPALATKAALDALKLNPSGRRAAWQLMQLAIDAGDEAGVRRWFAWQRQAAAAPVDGEQLERFLAEAREHHQ